MVSEATTASDLPVPDESGVLQQVDEELGDEDELDGGESPPRPAGDGAQVEHIAATLHFTPLWNQ